MGGKEGFVSAIICLFSFLLVCVHACVRVGFDGALVKSEYR